MLTTDITRKSVGNLIENSGYLFLSPTLPIISLKCYCYICYQSFSACVAAIIWHPDSLKSTLYCCNNIVLWNTSDTDF